MITTKLKELVRIEADNLRKYATKEELQKLNFKRLRPTSSTQCIYGQMTGDCFLFRATELIKKCATSYIYFDEDLYNDDAEWTFADYKNAWLQNYFTEDKTERLRFFSPIEIYIGHENAKSKNLIEYLRGETDTLEL